MFNCWVIEFSIKIDTKTKLVNGMSFDQAMAEGKYFQLILQLYNIFLLFGLLYFSGDVSTAMLAIKNLEKQCGLWMTMWKHY